VSARWPLRCAGSGERVEGEVAASLDPFIVLLGQHGADQSGDGVAVGEDANHVGAAADLLVQSPSLR